MNRSRIVSAFLACLLVTAGVAGPMSQPAAAASGDTCSGLDAVIYDVMTWQNIAEDPDNPCSTQYQVNQAIQDMKESDANQTKTDLYSHATQVATSNENWGTTHDNYVNDTESVAWMKMQVAVSEAYQNGSTEVQARQAGLDALREYYATKQTNLLTKWNTNLRAHQELRERAQNETNITASFIGVDGAVTNGDSLLTESEINYGGLNNETLTLADGTTANGLTVVSSSSHYDTVNIGISDGHTVTYNQGTEQGTIYGLRVDAPDETFSQLNYNDFNEFQNRWNRLETLESNLEPEVESFVNATYADFEAGNINASDVISANTAMFEYGTFDNTTDGNLYRSVGALSMMGFDTPTLNGTGTMTVTYQNQQYEGLLMAHNAPNGSWTTNTTYNTSNINGTVFFATTAGGKVDFADGEEFRINEIRNEDGTSADSVNTTQYAYKTANTSEFIAMQEELSALRAEIESREPSGGGGGSGGFGGNTMLIVLAAAAAAAIALGSQNGGGGRGRGRR